MRVAVVGKGGAGKSVVAGTIARVLARRGARVLALDSDPMPGLALTLGLGPLTDAMLTDAAEKDADGRWRLKKGIGPARAVQRYSVVGPDGVRLIQFGKSTAEGLGPIMGSLNAFYQLVHRLARTPVLRDWDVVGDLPAGPRQTAFNWAPYAQASLLVVEPTWKSVLSARRIARIARSRGSVVLPVANKVEKSEGVELVEEVLKESVFGAIPADDAVADADRLGVALLDHAPGSEAVRAIEGLVDRLVGHNLERATAR